MTKKVKLCVYVKQKLIILSPLYIQEAVLQLHEIGLYIIKF